MAKQDTKNTEKTTNMAQTDKKTPPDVIKTAPADVVDPLYIKCYELANEYISMLDDSSEIYKNNGLFVGMIKYIYRYYLKDNVLRNNDHDAGNRYDFNILDKLFYIYCDMVYRYKQNKRASILEFSLFVNISRDTMYNAATGKTRKLSARDTVTVKRWFEECENTLTNGNGVFEIFLLKSQYRYNDNLAPVPVVDSGPLLTAGQLPDLAQQKLAKKSQ